MDLPPAVRKRMNAMSPFVLNLPESVASLISHGNEERRALEATYAAHILANFPSFRERLDYPVLGVL